MTAPRVPKNGKKSADAAAMAPPSRITAMALVPNEQFVVFSGHESGAIHRLRRNAPADEPPLVTLAGHAAAVTGLSAPATADEVTSCSLDGTVKIWQSTVQPPDAIGIGGGPGAKRCIKTITVGTPLRSMLQSPDGSIYLGTTTGSIIRVEGNKVADELTGGHCDAVTALVLAESGALLSASLDGTVVGWDLASRTPVYVFKGHGGHIRAAAVHGTHLLTCGSDEVLGCFAVPPDFSPPAAADGSDMMYGGAGAGAGAGAAGGGDEEGYGADTTGAAGDSDAAAAAADEGADAAAAGAADAGGAQDDATPALTKIAWVIKPSAKLRLPWLPTSIVVQGNFAIIGTSARIVASVNVRMLVAKIAEYAARVETSIAQAERKLRKLAAEKKKRAHRAARKAVREFKQAHGGGGGGGGGGGADGDEYEGGAGEEEEQYDEDGNLISGGGGEGGADNAYEIEEFERAQQQEAQDKAAEIDSDAAAQAARFGRLRNQFYTQAAGQFITTAMCDIVPGVCADSVLAVVGEGAKIFAASGAAVNVLTLRPRVRAV